MKKKIIGVLFILCAIAIAVNSVAAADILSNIISQGNKLNDLDSSGIGTAVEKFLTGSIVPMIGAIGNLIFAGVTVVLGVKYIWSGAEGKADVQESLPAFVLAVVFFYLAGTVVNIAIDATKDVVGANNWTSVSSKIIWIINSVVKYLALAGVVGLGIKYMFASAEGRASMKTSMGGVVLGLVFVFLASNVVGFIVSATRDVVIL